MSKLIINPTSVDLPTNYYGYDYVVPANGSLEGDLSLAQHYQGIYPMVVLEDIQLSDQSDDQGVEEEDGQSEDQEVELPEVETISLSEAKGPRRLLRRVVKK